MNAKKIILLLLLVTQTTLVFPHQHDLALTISINGGKPGKGQIILSLFSSAENFLKKPILSRSQPVDNSGKANFLLNGLASGQYAVSVIYDEDKNGELNLGLLGIPRELVGFSNNVKGIFGPPKFSKAAFTLTRTDEIRIQLGKAKN